MLLAQLPQEITSLGVGGIFAVLVIREVLTFVKSTRKKKNECDLGDVNRNARLAALAHETLDKWDPLFQKLVHQTDELWRLHNQRDEDGVPLWYVRRSFEEAIKAMNDAIGRLASSIERQTTMFESMYREFSELRGELRAGGA